MKISTLIIAVLIIAGGGLLLKNKTRNTPLNYYQNYSPIPANNVTIENGKQIIEIKARGGYSPRTSVAKAGLSTVLRFSTNNTFDCSSAIRLPSLDISQNLPISGQTDIEIPSPEVGTLKGTCSMGMYHFEIVFQS